MIGPDDDLKKNKTSQILSERFLGGVTTKMSSAHYATTRTAHFANFWCQLLPLTESSRSKGQKLTYGVSCWVGKTANLRAKPPATQLASLNSNYANSAPHPVQVLMRRDGKCAKAFQDCSCEHGVSAEASIPHSSSTHSALLVLARLEGTS